MVDKPPEVDEYRALVDQLREAAQAAGIKVAAGWSLQGPTEAGNPRWTVVDEAGARVLVLGVAADTIRDKVATMVAYYGQVQKQLEGKN